MKMENYKSLDYIRPGEKAVVLSLDTVGSMRRRLLDLGLVSDTEVECVGRSPGGDPAAYLIRGAVIAIRSEDCRNIRVREVSSGRKEEPAWDLQTALPEKTRRTADF